MATETQLTPMMAQYRRIKSELPLETLLLFRLGDFYEMFFEDAQVGAQILNVALTKRGIVPMCGIPYHAATNYISRILKAGRKVAICDQVEEARPGQLVKREVTSILSPGTHFDERMLNPDRNNYLASICKFKDGFAFAVVDLTTGDFKTTELSNEPELIAELERLRPTELIFPAADNHLKSLAGTYCRAFTGYDDWVFAAETAVFTLRDHFKVASLDGFGLRERTGAVGAAAAIIHYLATHLRRDVTHLTRLSFYQTKDYLILDAVSLRNLEILEPLNKDAASPSSLYAAMNRTVTPMGARMLRDWITQPLASVAAIRARQEAVQLWLDQSSICEDFRGKLSAVRDLERTVGRLSLGSGNARDLVALKAALQQIPFIKGLIQQLLAAFSKGMEPALIHSTHGDSGLDTTSLIHALNEKLGAHPELTHLLERAVVDEPPLAVKEGGMIRGGFNTDLDELRNASRDGKNWIAKLQEQEIQRTGITSLKIRFNSVFGYYIEVTKSNLDKVPQNYVRKQTIANGERYITQELKEMEGKILGAEERTTKLEYELFQQVREQVLANLATIQTSARSLAQLDVLAGFAESARLHNYCRPIVGHKKGFCISEGRHPVLDQHITGERFVPNDTELDETQSIALITGPNMAGKSTYIRQVALLALMSHTGSFIPARQAQMELLDRIFTRIGASDDLSRGHSTFMVEMNETANILNNASPQSLVILDEIGRGTSTFDGLSLAWAIVEHLHNQVGAKVLFATHYHELTELAQRLPRLRNYNVAVREWNDQIVFLRKIIPGGTDKSYGIQVARLAGVPRPVLERAKVILSNLEESELTPEGNVRVSNRKQADREKLRSLEAVPQLDLFTQA